jgi:hypothetical protein
MLRGSTIGGAPASIREGRLAHEDLATMQIPRERASQIFRIGIGLERRMPRLESRETQLLAGPPAFNVERRPA